MIQSEHVSRILSLFPSLADIAEEDWHQDGLQVIQVEADYIIDKSQFVEFVVMILDGTLRTYKISVTGREITLYRVHSGECCPLMTSSILGPSGYEAIACVETVGSMLIIPAKIFRAWMDRYPVFRQFITQSLPRGCSIWPVYWIRFILNRFVEEFQNFLFNSLNRAAIQIHCILLIRACLLNWGQPVK